MDFQWLKTQFNLHPEKTKAGLAEALGLEPPAVSKILKGTRQIKAHEYVAMRHYFGLPVDGAQALHRSEGFTIQPLEFAAFEDQNNPGNGHSAEWVIPAEILSRRTQAPSNKIRIFQVNENIMEPDFKQGDHVLVDLSDIKPSPPGSFIISDGFGHMIRLCGFLPKSNPPKIRISAHCKNFQAQILKLDEFMIIGRVIAKLQML